MVGVISSAALWQTRLLFPALIPFALPTALGWSALRRLDTPHLSISFLVNLIVGGVVAVTLMEAGIGIVQRNPLAYALGLETRDAYLKKVQPFYAQAIELVASAPEDAKIYALLEPRSYYFPREVQPDPILDNFAHDLYIFGSPEAVAQFWQEAGYTHVLLYRRGLDFMLENDPDNFSPEFQAALDEVIRAHLNLIGTISGGAYDLYEIVDGSQ